MRIPTRYAALVFVAVFFATTFVVLKEVQAANNNAQVLNYAQGSRRWQQ